MNEEYFSLDELDELETDSKKQKQKKEYLGETTEDSIIEETSNNDTEDLLSLADNKKSKKNKKTKKKNKDNEENENTKNPKKLGIGKILLISVLPAVVTLTSGLILGLSLGSVDTTSNAGKPIEAISNTVSLADRVTSIKDAQMKVLNSQIANLIDDTNSLDNKAALVNGLIDTAISDTVNNLMSATLADSYNKSDNERVVNIKPYFAISDSTSEDETSKQITKNMNNFVSSNSIAKQLKTTTAKAGNAFVSILAMNSDLSVIYQVIAPVVTSDGQVYEALYIVRLDTNNKVTAMSYIGYVDGDAGTGYYDSFNATIKNAIEQSKQESVAPTDNSDITQNNSESKKTTDKSADTSASSSQTGETINSTDNSNTESQAQ